MLVTGPLHRIKPIGANASLALNEWLLLPCLYEGVYAHIFDLRGESQVGVASGASFRLCFNPRVSADQNKGIPFFLKCAGMQEARATAH